MTHITDVTDPPAVPGDGTDKLATRIRSFVEANGGSATGLINPMGRRGARVIVVSVDGPFTDAVVADVARGESLCAAAGVPVGTWDRETTGRITVSNTDRRRMAGTGR